MKKQVPLCMKYQNLHVWLADYRHRFHVINMNNTDNKLHNNTSLLMCGRASWQIFFGAIHLTTWTGYKQLSRYYSGSSYRSAERCPRTCLMQNLVNTLTSAVVHSGTTYSKSYQSTIRISKHESPSLQTVINATTRIFKSVRHSMSYRCHACFHGNERNFEYLLSCL